MKIKHLNDFSMVYVYKENYLNIQESDEYIQTLSGLEHKRLVFGK